MTGRDLIRVLASSRSDRHLFIKWWSENNGDPNIELLDSFLDTAKIGDRFGGFELLDLEDMWVIVKMRFGDHVERKTVNDQELLVWEETGPSGASQRFSTQFAPEDLIKVYESQPPQDED